MITLWHNPRCSKSRQAIAILEESGAPHMIRRYLDDTPTAAELTALGIAPADLIRRGEKIYKELGLGKDARAETLLSAMVTHPILIERPIAIKDGKAIIGRPPEAIKILL